MTSRSNYPTVEIGGYFGLDLPLHEDAFPGTLQFQSGRAALRAVIEGAEIKRIMVPAYICDSVIQAIVDSGAAVETYRLDDALYPKSMLGSGANRDSVLLYVNYYGLCASNITRLLKAIPNNKLIIDNSQALFASATSALATIYSPRKFVAVPDGGLLIAESLDLRVPEVEDSGTLGRMRHLLVRMSDTAHAGYADYLESEASLNETKPLKMSRLSKLILSSIDMTMVKRRRRENFLVLATSLDKYNAEKWKIGSKIVPMCYPLVLKEDVRQLREKLINKGIYIPTYWPEAKSRVQDGVENKLTNFCLAVPCDQRYTRDQMLYLINEIVSELVSK